MLNGLAPIGETTAQEFCADREAVLTRIEPLVVRGLVRDWPVVAAAREGADALVRYLLTFYRGATVNLSVGAPEANGRIFYNAAMTAPNTEIVRERLDRVLERLLSHRSDAAPPLLYVASTTIDTSFPGLQSDNPSPAADREPLASIWIGNRSRVAAHHDLPDNLACVAAGRRRFTLFPPDELENLYVGPIDITPAGQAISLVDLSAPDFDRHPKFRKALERAKVAELEPGDAIFIPSMWWHHVEGLETVNILMNYWWRRSPMHMGPPQNALFHALLSVRDLPPEQKRVWRRMFDHYVFDNDAETVAHIPPERRGVLGPMTEDTARRIRAHLLNRLNR